MPRGVRRPSDAPSKFRPKAGFSISSIAAIAHEANRQLQREHGEVVNFPWESTSESLRSSARDGVASFLRNGNTAKQSHANWLKFKKVEGWTYGEVKDFAAKTHPCMVPFEELPAAQQAKDEVFIAICKALSEKAD